MIAAKNDVSRYNTEMNAYLDCIKLEIDAATPKDPSKLSKPTKRRRPMEQEKMLTAEEQCGGRRAPGGGRAIQRAVEGLQGRSTHLEAARRITIRRDF